MGIQEFALRTQSIILCTQICRSAGARVFATLFQDPDKKHATGSGRQVEGDKISKSYRTGFPAWAARKSRGCAILPISPLGGARNGKYFPVIVPNPPHR